MFRVRTLSIHFYLSRCEAALKRIIIKLAELTSYRYEDILNYFVFVILK